MRFFPTLLALPLLALLLGAGCKKDKVTPLEQLPPATATGANTFGCLVNGEVWKAEGASHMRADWTVPTSCYCNMGFSEKRSGQTVYNSITLGIQSGFVTGVYSLSSSVTGAHARLQLRDVFYTYDRVIGGELLLTRLDKQVGIMAGTFHFIMVGASGDTVRVTDGRFDIGNMDR